MKYRGFSPIGEYKEGAGYETNYYARIQGRTWIFGRWNPYVIWRNDGYGYAWRNLESGSQMPAQQAINELSASHYAEKGLEKMQQEKKQVTA